MFVNLLLAIFFATCLTWQSDEHASMPSLNYWNISLEILKKPQFALELGVSKLQRDQIRTMRSSERFLKLYSDVRKKNDELEDADIWLMLDGEVKQTLAEILSADQLRDCRTEYLRQRFPTVRAFFSDDEVLSYLRLEDRDRRSLEKTIAQLSAAHDVSISALRVASAKKILDIVPLSSHQKFADYLGNDRSLSLSPTRDLKFENVPFPPVCTNGSLMFYLPSVDTLRLSNKQKLEIEEIASKRDDQMSSYSGNDVSGFSRMLQKETYEAMIQVLTPQQHVVVSQYVARSEFLLDVSVPLSRRAFVQYLDMGIKQDEVVEFARSTSESTRERIQEIEQTLFESIVDVLPLDARSRVKSLLPNGYIVHE